MKFDPKFQDLGQTLQSRGFASTIWKTIFLLHLIAIFILSIFLCIHGLLNKRPSFHGAHWYPPVLSASCFASIISTTWLLFVLRWPSASIKTSFRLSPLFTLVLSLLLFNAESALALSFGALFLLLSLILSLYSCWINHRIPQTIEILTSSLLQIGSLNLGFLIATSLGAGLFWSATWSLGIGGISAERPHLSAFYVIILLFSLAWTMQVIRNTLTVTISAISYTMFNRTVEVDSGKTWARCLGSVCLGSAVVPAIVVIRGAARSMNLMAESADEFLFSCVACLMGLSGRLIELGNRWGFVHVGVFRKGFVEASEDTWRLFIVRGMEKAVNVDLTSSFCFFAAVGVGGAAGLFAGIWATVVEKDYTAEVALCSFVIGYFMVSQPFDSILKLVVFQSSA